MATKEKDLTYTFSAAQLQTPRDLIQRYGVKILLYGGPGTKKTPLLFTAPNVRVGFAEVGMLSVKGVNTRNSTMIDTYAKIRDFVLWSTRSNETNGCTIGFDSWSKVAQIVLDEEKQKTAHGQKAYGEMGEKMDELLNWLLFAPNRDVVLLAQQVLLEIEGEGKKLRPSFPGRTLDSAIPHAIDCIWRSEMVPSTRPELAGQMVQVIRTRESYAAFARDRTMVMDEIERPDLTYLINKAKQ